MGVEINRLTSPTTMLANGSTYRRLSTDTHALLPQNGSVIEPNLDDSPPSSPHTLRLNHLDRDLDDSPNSSTGETAGIYLGILNLFTTLPQFVGTFISMIVFAIVEPGKSRELAEGEQPEVRKEGVNAIAVCLAIGALSSLGAAYATRRLKFVR